MKRILKSKKLFFAKFIGAAFFLLAASCAKKDESTKNSTSRLNPTAGSTGARSVNPTGSQAALDAATSQGVTSFHIESISQPQATLVEGYDAIQVRSVVNFNQQTYPLVTTHDRIQDITVSQVQQMRSGEFYIEAQGVCSDAQCSVYYLVLNIYKGYAAVVQLIQKQSFVYGPSRNASNYQSGSQFATSVTQVFQILGPPTN